MKYTVMVKDTCAPEDNFRFILPIPMLNDKGKRMASFTPIESIREDVITFQNPTAAEDYILNAKATAAYAYLIIKVCGTGIAGKDKYAYTTNYPHFT